MTVTEILYFQSTIVDFILADDFTFQHLLRISNILVKELNFRFLIVFFQITKKYTSYKKFEFFFVFCEKCDTQRSGSGAFFTKKKNRLK